MDFYRSKMGFTLAETLISLMILGILAIYTIPKVMVGSLNSRYNAIAKEFTSSVSAVCSNMKSQGLIRNGTAFRDMTPYINYVKVDTSTVIDDWYTGTSFGCDNTGNPCLKLSNGALVVYSDGGAGSVFTGTTNLHALDFQIDPDGRYSGTTTGNGKAVNMLLYYNCRVTDRGGVTPGTIHNGSPTSPDPSKNPPWFSW